MSENGANAYFDSMIGHRASRLTEEEQLEGATTVSLETCSDLAKDDFLSAIQQNFRGFLRGLRFLSPREQEILLSYYLLGKTQMTLGTIHKFTQTVCSTKIRMAVQRLGTFILLGKPTVEALARILTKASWKIPSREFHF